MHSNERRRKVPWITEDGEVDLAKLPIDGVLQQSLDLNPVPFRSAVNLLRSMHNHGRREAGVFLLGLLVVCDDNLERRSLIVEALQGINTKACADLLFGELSRVKSSNTTRRYLATVIRVLASMPPELIQDGFGALAEDRSFSQKMRAKFKAAIAESHPLGEEWL